MHLFFGVASSFLQISHEFSNELPRKAPSCWRIASRRPGWYLGWMDRGVVKGVAGNVCISFLLFFSEGVVIFLAMAWYILSLFFGIMSLFFGLKWVLKETFVNKCDANHVLYHIRLYTISSFRKGLWQLMLYWGTIFTWNTNPSTQHSTVFGSKFP